MGLYDLPSITVQNGCHQLGSSLVDLPRHEAFVVLGGEFDASSSEMLMEKLKVLVANGQVDLTLDLSGVGFLSASTIGVIVELREQFRKNNRVFTVESPSAEVRRAFVACGLDSLLQTKELYLSADQDVVNSKVLDGNVWESKVLEPKVLEPKVLDTRELDTRELGPQSSSLEGGGETQGRSGHALGSWVTVAPERSESGTSSPTRLNSPQLTVALDAVCSHYEKPANSFPVGGFALKNVVLGTNSVGCGWL